jgi:hypothetical protein
VGFLYHPDVVRGILSIIFHKSDFETDFGTISMILRRISLQVIPGCIPSGRFQQDRPDVSKIVK